MAQPKLGDVAARAGVSPTTVSRVLNNRGYLSQKTRDKVFTAIRELGYRPNAIARSLQERRSHIIGLIFRPWRILFMGKWCTVWSRVWRTRVTG